MKETDLWTEYTKKLPATNYFSIKTSWTLNSPFFDQ